MPNYDFLCDTCDKTVEFQVPLSCYDEVKAHGIKCPLEGCEGNMTQVPAAPGIKFKGRGWTPKFGPR